MSRIDQRFRSLRESGRKALIPYIVAGDPSLDVTLPMMHELVRQGADIIELGVPFSDPMAEGPVIQLGHERALAGGTGLRKVLAIVAEFREENDETPILLMGYTNPIEAMGRSEFVRAAAKAGVDAVLTVDMPPEEVEGFAQDLAAHDIDNVLLIAPTTPDERIERIVNYARGFVYFVSLKGVTGAGHLDVDAVAQDCARIRRYTDLPLAVGFGIKDSYSATAVAQFGDAAVIGSALVDRMVGIDVSAGLEEQLARAAALIGEIRAGLDAMDEAK